MPLVDPIAQQVKGNMRNTQAGCHLHGGEWVEFDRPRTAGKILAECTGYELNLPVYPLVYDANINTTGGTINGVDAMTVHQPATRRQGLIQMF